MPSWWVSSSPPQRSRRSGSCSCSAALLIPCLAHFLPGPLPLPAFLETTVTTARPLALVRVRDAGARVIARAQDGFPLDRVLLIGWVVAALGLGQLMLYSMAAVVGWKKLDIVLPEWVLVLAEDARALVVRHEVEHVDRRDPRLLLHAFFVVLALPWNPAIWWQFRRLRRAIELDCDARVIGSGANVARYGEVLIEASGFCRSAGLPALATFAERSSDLEARIKALAPVAPRRRLLPAAIGGFAAVVLAAAACLVPDPLSPELAQRVAEAARAPTGAPSGIAWVRAHLSGMGPAEVVILVRSSTGQLLAKEQIRRGTTASARLRLVGRGPGVLEGVPSASIESVEVVRGGAIGVPGIEGVIVVTLKPGVTLPTR